MQVLKDEIRESILEIALNEFYKNGYEKTSMSLIASKCGISKSNLYRYFTSKEDIYHTITDPICKRVFEVNAYITGEEFLDNTRDVIGKIIADKLFPLIRDAARELSILLDTKLPDSDVPIKKLLIQNISESLNSHFDAEKLSKSFSNILATMLVVSVEQILKNDSDSNGRYNELLELFRYHAHGVCAFK